MDQKTRTDARFVNGHNVYWDIEDLFPHKNIRRITIMRHPVEVVISNYHDFLDEYELEKKKRGSLHWLTMQALLDEKGSIRSPRELFESNPLYHNHTFKFLADRFFDYHVAHEAIDPYTDTNRAHATLHAIKEKLDQFFLSACMTIIFLTPRICTALWE